MEEQAPQHCTVCKNKLSENLRNTKRTYSLTRMKNCVVFYKTAWKRGESRWAPPWRWRPPALLWWLSPESCFIIRWDFTAVKLRAGCLFQAGLKALCSPPLLRFKLQPPECHKQAQRTHHHCSFAVSSMCSLQTAWMGSATQIRLHAAQQSSLCFSTHTHTKPRSRNPEALWDVYWNKITTSHSEAC